MPTHASFNPHDLLNQTIGDYQLCELLGVGNALVYRALDKGKGEYVALKLVSWPGAPVDETALRRFAREIRVLRERHHAAIVPIYDWHPTGDYVYVTMEYCDGTLGRWLREHRPTLTEVLQIAEPLAAALDFLHAGPPPVLHRDIKPANILFKGRNWYLSDFSIARMEADQFVTTDGTTLGTLRYAAPEQITGAKLSAETDIYSFGLVVYEMLAGGWVLGARRQPDWGFDVPPISRFQRGLSPAVDDLFYRWLAPRPADRPHRAGDAVRELAAAAGILRNPALARLYDLATALAGRPRDAAAWSQARDLLAAIALHEPAFFDPRGLAAELERRQDGGAPGPPPPGYSGAHPLDFYSEKTVFAPSRAEDGAGEEPAPSGDADGDRAAAEPPAPRLLPAGDAGAATFAPRSRYDATATLYVPASMVVAGSVFGRKVVVEAGARVEGDIYSLGDLTLGARAEVGGSVLAGGALRAEAGAAIAGAAGAQGESVHLGAHAELPGWAMAGGALAVASGVAAAGLLAGGPLAFAGPAEVAAATVASTGGAVDLQGSVRLGGLLATAEHVQRWTPATVPASPAPAHLLSSLLTRRGRELAEETQRQVTTPAALAAPRPVVAAEEPSLETTPATEGPTLYLPAALRLDPAAPPAALPAADGDWEGALAGAWLLDGLWAELARPARLLAAAAAAGTLLCVAAVLWLALGGLAGTAGIVLLAWCGLLAVGTVALWLLRPRALELVRLWWAWETWSQADGVLLWDTLHQGTPPGYLEPGAPLAPLGALAAAVAAAGDDTATLDALTTLTKTLEHLPWKSWPGVFAPHPATGTVPDAPPAGGPPLAATELLHLPVEMLPAEHLSRMRVLVPRLDPEFVRAGADRLAAWPAYLAEARALWRSVAQHVGVLEGLLDRWDAAAAAAAAGTAAAGTGLITHQARAAALAEETLIVLEQEVAPEIDQLWTLHVDGTKLVSAYYAHALDARRVAGRRDQDRSAARVATAERELRRCEGALGEVEAELRPLAGRWTELDATHARTGAELQGAWKRVRAQLARAAGAGEPFVAARPVDVRQAATLVPQLARDATGLIRQGEELTAACAKDERDWPNDLPWPPWPARITAPLAMDTELAALEALLRKLRGEPARARTRQDTLRNLLAKTTLALERALGAQEALAQAIVAAGADPLGEPGRLAGLETQAGGLILLLRRLLADLARWQRRVELNTVAYADVVDLLLQALKGGRSGPAWELGARVQADYRRLDTELAATGEAREQARLALAAAQDEAQRGQAETEAAVLRLAQAEQDLVARSEAQAGEEETTLRRHIAGLRARHEVVLADLAIRAGWLEALAAWDAAGASLKIEAAERLRERIQILAAFADGRIAETAAARAAALWPLDVWPAGDMLYLLPVWLLRYRPLGWRRAPRLRALTPGTVRAVPGAGRVRPAAGFAVDVQPGLAARFAADILTWADAGAGVPAPLAGENLLASAAGLAGRWRTLAGAGLVPPWLARFLPFL